MQTVTIHTPGWVRDEAGTKAVEVVLTYEPDDPYAVRVRVTGGHDDLDWLFGRDLLADGLRSMVPLGDGDVQVQATSVLTEISHIDDLGETVLLRLPWWNTREFIRLCCLQVPRGQERCDVDSWVAALTASDDAA
jgi:hypothetical protein